MRNPPARNPKDDDLNERYNVVAKNSLVDMDWRVLKYGENILLGEIKKLVDMLQVISHKAENKRKRDMKLKMSVKSDLDDEMRKLSQVIESIDSEIEENEIKVTTTVVKSTENVIPVKKAKLNVDEPKLTSPVFKVKRVKPITLDVIKLSPEREPHILSPQGEKDESTEIVLKPEVIQNKTNTLTREVKMEFWKLFKDDTEWWKAIAKRNLEKMEETRRDLERFSGHELVLEDIKMERDIHEKEKASLQTFIEEIDKSKAINRDLEYDKKYEEIVLKLIEFAKKDFIYKGFDPLIEQLKALSNVKIEGRKKKVVNIQDIINIYTQIDISKYTYEELCLLEKYYKEIIRKYKIETLGKENVLPEPKKDSSVFKDVIINVENKFTSENTNQLSDTLKRKHRNMEIFDLTRTYPEQYYANNWWKIYEDVLKSREKQFGSIDSWWTFYETMLNKKETTEEELRKIREIVEYRSGRRRPNSRMEDLLKMLDGIRNDKFMESEAVSRKDDESVRF